MNNLIVYLIKSMSKQASMKKGLITSIRASYMEEEIRSLIDQSRLEGAEIKMNMMGFEFKGRKER